MRNLLAFSLGLPTSLCLLLALSWGSKLEGNWELLWAIWWMGARLCTGLALAYWSLWGWGKRS